MDSSEDDEQTENYHNFFNFSISNEGNWLSCFWSVEFCQVQRERDKFTLKLEPAD